MKNLKKGFKIKGFVLYLIMISLLLVKLIIKSNQYSELQKNQSEIVDKYFDLQQEYDIILEENIRLEEENQLLGSYAASQALTVNEND